MTSFDDVIALFLSKITTFEEFLNLTEEELSEEFTIALKSAMAKFINKKDIVADYEGRIFNRTLTDLEQEIISLGMVLAWITPKVNNIELMKPMLSSKDYTVFSQANHLKEMKDMKDIAENDFHYWINRYILQGVMESQGGN